MTEKTVTRARRLFSLFVACALLLAGTGISAPAEAAKSKKSKENPRYASMVMDADTGVILHQSNPDKPVHPASLTKVMTLLILFEALESGKITLKDRIPISRHAASMAPSKLGLAAGSSIRVQDAIYAIVTKSANDIAVAVAERLGGTESGFARIMTRHAHEIGMTSTTFTNASGLHNPRQISTARDMARLARHVITRYPGYYRYYSTANFRYQGHSYHNHNRLMETYKGMDGMKTGYVNSSGFNLVASAVRGNHRLIGVVFGGRSAASRNTHMAQLLDQGFAKLRGRSSGDLRIAKAEPAAPAAVIPASLAGMTPPAAQDAAPTPPRKPPILVALNTLTRPEMLQPAAGESAKPQVIYMQQAQAKEAATRAQNASMEKVLQNAAFSEQAGQGDIDPAETNRIQTGLIAVSAMKAEEKRSAEQKDAWAIQVGAFASRAATDQALHDTVKKLPVRLASASPLIAPLKTRDGWVFRARLNGFTREDAFQACKYLSECVPLAPLKN